MSYSYYGRTELRKHKIARFFEKIGEWVVSVLKIGGAPLSVIAGFSLGQLIIGF